MRHSDKMHIVERFRLAEADRLEVETTIHDPEALTKPLTRTARYGRHRDWTLAEYVCQQNNRNFTTDDGKSGIDLELRGAAMIENDDESQRRARALRHVGMVLGSVIGILALAAWTSRAEAHHSFSVFDMQTNKDLEGEVVEFQWTNPHTFLWINVTNADGSQDALGPRRHEPELLGPPRLDEEHLRARRQGQSRRLAAEERRARRHAAARDVRGRHRGRELRRRAAAANRFSPL